MAGSPSWHRSWSPPRATSRAACRFGGLMMVVGAFNQVQQALRWFVDNFSRIADWRATLLRVVSFRRALIGLEEDASTGGNIRRTGRADAEPRPRAPERRPGRGPGVARRAAGRHRARRPGADRGRARRRQEHALSGHRRALAMGRRQPPAPAARRHDVHAASPLSAARQPARGHHLPGRHRRLRAGGHRGGARAAGARAAGAVARPRASAGTASCRSTISSGWPSCACCCTRQAGSSSTMPWAPSSDGASSYRARPLRAGAARDGGRRHQPNARHRGLLHADLSSPAAGRCATGIPAAARAVALARRRSRACVAEATLA